MQQHLVQMFEQYDIPMNGSPLADFLKNSFFV
jgi:hypothetical protein